VLFAVVLFLSLPLPTLMSSKKDKDELELTKVATLDTPPPEEVKAPEPPPQQQKQEEIAAPEISTAQAQPISLDQLTADVAVGGGGFLAGMLAPSSTGVETMQESVKEMVFSMEDLDQKPVAVAQIQPTHPRDLLKAKVEGQVVLLFVVDEEGRVEDPRVENSSRPEFEKPALDAVRKWKFKPGTKEGAPVKTYIRQPIRFSIARY
jgi:protein TonB